MSNIAGQVDPSVGEGARLGRGGNTGKPLRCVFLVTALVSCPGFVQVGPGGCCELPARGCLACRANIVAEFALPRQRMSVTGADQHCVSAGAGLRGARLSLSATEFRRGWGCYQMMVARPLLPGEPLLLLLAAATPPVPGTTTLWRSGSLADERRDEATFAQAGHATGRAFWSRSRLSPPAEM